MLNNLRLVQLYAVLRLEIGKTFFSRRGLWVYLLALLPVLLFVGHSFQMLRTGRPCDFGLDTTILATIFQLFYLRLVIFFGCVGIFTNLFRGEVLDKSLHYYFLAPVRREVVLAGKFLAGLFSATVIFGLSTTFQFFAMYAHYQPSAFAEYLFRNNGMEHLAAYVGVTALACAGYGSVFLAAGILYRNPIVPAATILVWESINSFLPPLLQKFSVIYYVKSLCPIEVIPRIPPPLNFLAVNPDPISPFIAIPGLLAVATMIVVIAVFRIRRMEIQYGTD